MANSFGLGSKDKFCVSKLFIVVFLVGIVFLSIVLISNGINSNKLTSNSKAAIACPTDRCTNDTTCSAIGKKSVGPGGGMYTCCAAHKSNLHDWAWATWSPTGCLDETSSASASDSATVNTCKWTSISGGSGGTCSGSCGTGTCQGTYGNCSCQQDTTVKTENTCEWAVISGVSGRACIGGACGPNRTGTCQNINGDCLCKDITAPVTVPATPPDGCVDTGEGGKCTQKGCLTVDSTYSCDSTRKWCCAPKTETVPTASKTVAGEIKIAGDPNATDKSTKYITIYIDCSGITKDGSNLALCKKVQDGIATVNGTSWKIALPDSNPHTLMAVMWNGDNQFYKMTDYSVSVTGGDTGKELLFTFPTTAAASVVSAPVTQPPASDCTPRTCNDICSATYGLASKKGSDIKFFKSEETNNFYKDQGCTEAPYYIKLDEKYYLKDDCQCVKLYSYKVTNDCNGSINVDKIVFTRFIIDVQFLDVKKVLNAGESTQKETYADWCQGNVWLKYRDTSNRARYTVFSCSDQTNIHVSGTNCEYF